MLLLLMVLCLRVQYIFYKALYVFDLRPIESSMLFAFFHPLRTPVPNDQSSHILACWKGKDGQS
jgi:hypothetical protein